MRRLPMCLLAIGVVSLVVMTARPATAASIVFSGADVGGGIGGPRVNSDAAHSAWLLAAGGVDASEDFEGWAVGATAPLPLAGGMTLSTVDAAVPGGPFQLNQVTNDQHNEIGYNTTAGGQNYFRFSPDFSTPATMTLTFADPVTAFGVYITGVQNGFALTTALWGGDSFQLADTQGVAGIAGVQFFGFVSDVPIGSISFFTEPGVGIRDVVGFDDIEINSVPEPTTVALVASGLIGIAIRRRRRS